jgi:hypothetical protein
VVSKLPSVKSGFHPKGPRPPRYSGSPQNFRHHFPATPPNDQVPAGPGGLPAQFLVTPYTPEQIRQMAQNRSAADVAAGLAALPSTDQVSHPYQQATAASAGLTQALADALGQTQRYQVGMAPAISGQYAQGATASQAGADAAAAALGGTAQQLAGSTGGAATALAVPAVEAGNATSGVIDAAKLQGANEQYRLNDQLAQALQGLGQQQAAVRAQGVSQFDQYLDQLNQQNTAIQGANTDNAFKYASLGIDQQNANTQAAYWAAQVGGANADRTALNQRTQAEIDAANARAAASAGTQAAGQQETRRHNLATEATAAYRATHPAAGAAGTARNPQGYSPSQVTTHLGSDINSLRTLAQNLHKPQGAVAPHQEVNIGYQYHPAVQGVVLQNQWTQGVAHVTPQQYQQFLQSGGPGHRNWSILGVPEKPGITKTTTATVGTPGHGARPSAGYWETLKRIQQTLATDDATYGYGLSPAQITQYAQRILREAGWTPDTTARTYNGPH